jgi:hypothetical protein
VCEQRADGPARLATRVLGRGGRPSCSP